jgi:4-hydroxy-3-methylbut-2-enyl diphosphate reductase
MSPESPVQELQYLVVRDKPETQLVCDTITQKPTGLSRTAFLEKFAKAVSPGFDPDLHLGRLGLANQTTMLSSESLEIAEMFRQAIRERFGESDAKTRFRNFDTICSATQDRQDAVMELGNTGPKMDLMIVIGGFNSSNTTHLAELGEAFSPTYHIQEVADIRNKDEIHHKPPTQKAPQITSNWLPLGKVTIGVTSGASTPNRIVGEAMLRMLEIVGDPLPTLPPVPAALRPPGKVPALEIFSAPHP